MSCISTTVRLPILVSWLTKLNWKMVKVQITSMSGTKPKIYIRRRSTLLGIVLVI